MPFEDVLGLAPEIRRIINPLLDSNEARVDALETHQTTYEAFINRLMEAASGDMVIVLDPTTTGSSAAEVTDDIAGAEGEYVRTVGVELQNAAGDVHTWFNGSLTVADTENTDGDGTAAADATVALTNGVGTISVAYIGTWIATDSQTITVSGTVLGNALAQKTSVDTLIA